MNLEKITSAFVENILKDWQKADFDATDIETLSAWLHVPSSLDEKRLLLRDQLYQLVLNASPPPFQQVVEEKHSEEKISALRELFLQSPSDESYLAVIYCRYLDIRKFSVHELAESIGVSKKTLRRYLLKGFDILALRIKTELKKKNTALNFAASKGYFPIIDAAQAVGIEGIVNEISTWLLDKSAFPAVSIEGIGGLGKTLLAKYLWQNLYEKNSFYGHVWVSARQKELSLSGEISSIENFASTLDDIAARLAHQLGQAHLAGFSTAEKLKGLEKLAEQNRLLIVLDNLETVNHVDELIPAMLRLTGSSKLLTTSRKSLSKFPQVRIFPIPELSFEDSRRLILSETRRRGITLPLSQETTLTLYGLTGGVPLALKLVTAQFGFISAKEIIDQLRAGEKKSQILYQYIYQQAWDLLDDLGKRLLLAMLTISPEGEDRAWICAVNNLSAQEFEQGLQQLQRLSLIEFSGSIEAPLYRIHRLTITFLQSKILSKWQEQ